ncbi:hypothetical protein C8J56DRAFT_27253 [Mycena floridula]|nr:hypothetical protein C8J56DRAFT_27253 [Mycena floridula]
MTFMSHAAMARRMNVTLTESTFGTIGGNVLSNNTMTTNAVNNFYPSTSHTSNLLSQHGRGYMPAGAILFGRDPELDFIVRCLIWEPETAAAKRARFTLLGTGGMGKTSIALNVVRDARLLARFPEYNQAWFPCVQATSFALLLDIIHSVLDIHSDTKHTLNDILKELQSSKPILLLFDNFETPWNAPGARADVAQFLRDIDAIPHVVLFITMRATIAPCDDITWQEMRIGPLDPEASYSLYTEIDKKARNDRNLSELLEMLGHMPLAVKLMARQGKSTGCTVKQLIGSYQHIGTAMLGPTEGSDPQNSVSISISMSLESPQIKRESNTSELLRIISMLPKGTTFQTLERYWAHDIPNLQSALQTLLEASLLECGAASYFVLPVIRSYVLHPARLPSAMRLSMVSAACRFLQQHNCVKLGEPNYKADLAARSAEEINLQSILLDTKSSDPDFIQALLTLAWHQYHQIQPRTEVIKHAVQLVNGTPAQKLIGDIFKCYAWVLYDLGQREKSLNYFKLARQTYLSVSELRLAALALLNIVEVSVDINPEAEEIPLIEQARLELQRIQSSSSDHHHHLPVLSSMHIRSKKVASPMPSAIEADDMARCLRNLGRAYLRSGRHSKAIEQLIPARQLCPALSFEGALCSYNLSRSYWYLQHYDEAEKWGLLALKEWKEMGNSNVGFVFEHLGKIYISKHQFTHAIEHLNEALDMAKARNNQWNTGVLLVKLGWAQMKKESNQDAQVSFMQALVHFEQLPQRVVGSMVIVCEFYLAKLENPTRNPTQEEQRALHSAGYAEDIPS